jgi:hypothetical protein
VAAVRAGRGEKDERVDERAHAAADGDDADDRRRREGEWRGARELRDALGLVGEDGEPVRAAARDDKLTAFVVFIWHRVS